MIIDPMLWLAIAAFAWGLSLASYRWFAVHNGWPMGEWHAHRPGLPIAIGLFSVLFAMLFAVARGGPTLVALPLIGLALALAWTTILRVGSQLSLLLAPLSVVVLLVFWMSAASSVSGAAHYGIDSSAVSYPAATDREADISERDRGITRVDENAAPPRSR